MNTITLYFSDDEGSATHSCSFNDDKLFGLELATMFRAAGERMHGGLSYQFIKFAIHALSDLENEAIGDEIKAIRDALFQAELVLDGMFLDDDDEA